MLQTREIDLYLKRNTGPTYVPFVQYENGWALKINLKDVEIPANSTATVYVKKPSGLGVYNTAVISSNAVICEIVSQMLAEYGKASCQVQISKDELMISTFTVIFDIRQSVADGCEESHNESNVLQEFVTRAEDAADTAESAAGQIGTSVEDAEAWAVGTRNGDPVDSSDPAYHNNSKYYADAVANAGQYAEDAEAYAAGTRDGDPVASDDPAYHNNAKYYAETAENAADAAETAAATFETDPTLSIEGKAADAKAVGDALEANTKGVQPDLTAGTAEQLLSQNVLTDTAPFLLRPTPTGAGTREEVEVIGGTVGWNQLANNASPPSDRSGLTISGGADGFTINGTASANISATGWFDLSTTVVPVLKNHVVYVSYKLISGTIEKTSESSSGTSFYLAQGGTAVSYGKESRIIKDSSASGSTSVFYVVSGTVFTNAKLQVQVIDLTALLGSTIADTVYAMETATAGAGVAWFQRYFGSDYKPYAALGLRSVEGVSAYETSTNCFDEEDAAWINGRFLNDQGASTTSTYYRYTYSYTPVKGGKMLRVSMNKTTVHAGGLTVCEYTEDKTFIRRQTVIASTESTGVFTGAIMMSDNAAYIRFSAPYGGAGTTALGGGSKDFVFLTPHIYPLDDTLTLMGMPRLDANNNLYFEGDVYKSDGTYRRWTNLIDLGSLSWTKATSEFRSETITSMWRPASQGSKAEMLSLKYEVLPASISGGQGVHQGYTGIAINTDGSFWLHDDTYETAAALKTALSGVYVLAWRTAPAVESATPYAPMMVCDPHGTEEFVTTGVVPVGHVTRYPEDAVAKLDGLPWDLSCIAPVEKAYKATRSYDAGRLLFVGNTLYKATASIANGATITVGTNVSATTLDEIIAALAE